MSIGSMPRPLAAGLDTLLRDRAQRTPEALAFRFVHDSRDPDAPGHTEAMTCAALDTRARSLAAALRSRVRPGDRVLLLHPHGPEYVAAFLACLYAGVVAVPANPPDTPAGAARVAAIVRDARPALFATDTAQLTDHRSSPGLRGVPGLATDTVDDDAATAPGRTATAGDIAFLQYTSGSTGDPRGVVVTHAGLLDNMAAMADRFRLTPDDRQVSWLPPYHDMGLILGILLPLCRGIDAVLSSPFEFMVDPLSWLENLTRFGGTFSAAPNFAYDLCVRKATPERAAALDLSAWRLAVNGAEPVRRATVERFAGRFARSGFSAERITPGYGLAEATLMVSGPDPGTGARVTPLPGHTGSRVVVGVGRAVTGTEVRIVAPDTLRTRPDGAEGEIWVRGPGVAAGYWGRPDATATTFAARPADAPDTGPYLRTGDLGLLRDGELYVTGRIKDVIIVHGRNHYPQDIEEAVWSAEPRLRPGCAAAFDTEGGDGATRLVVVAEYDGTPDGATAVGAAACRAVARECGLRLSELVLIRRRTVPKTSAGKIRRGTAKDAYLHGGLDEIARVPAPVGAGRG
ncbi:fatty acyl-AMP ligase [Streptomyces olivoreticuli]|uniref:fatty acyl-AMP ligase n=1 Tax=Streptomyces olivoreticuli TaxID=68246 RepID=UPI002659D140|nr:fatty acyl-AMP ligase [Streptomyces olivoreticuli]WKK24860.1 fatty acyl-AMP ligase [Streptomyces olivoreticuli]